MPCKGAVAERDPWADPHIGVGRAIAILATTAAAAATSATTASATGLLVFAFDDEVAAVSIAVLVAFGVVCSLALGRGVCLIAASSTAALALAVTVAVVFCSFGARLTTRRCPEGRGLFVGVLAVQAFFGENPFVLIVVFFPLMSPS